MTWYVYNNSSHNCACERSVDFSGYSNFRHKSSNWKNLQWTNDGSKVVHNIKHIWVIMWHIFTSTNNATTILFPTQLWELFYVIIPVHGIGSIKTTRGQITRRKLCFYYTCKFGVISIKYVIDLVLFYPYVYREMYQNTINYLWSAFPWPPFAFHIFFRNERSMGSNPMKNTK
jgi:hypothetical protein